MLFDVLGAIGLEWWNLIFRPLRGVVRPRPHVYSVLCQSFRFHYPYGSKVPKHRVCRDSRLGIVLMGLGRYLEFWYSDREVNIFGYLDPEVDMMEEHV